MNSMGLNKTWVNPVKYAVISATSDGDNQIVTAVTNRRIRGVSAQFAVNVQGTAQWQDDGANNLSGVESFAQYGGYSASADPNIGLFQSAAGQGIDLNMSAGVDGLGNMAYLEV